MAFKIVTAPHRILIKDIETGKVIFDEVIPETFGEKAVHLTGIALNAIEKIEENSREESAASITITNDTWALCEFFFILGRICGKKNSKRLFKWLITDKEPNPKDLFSDIKKETPKKDHLKLVD